MPGDTIVHTDGIVLEHSIFINDSVDADSLVKIVGDKIVFNRSFEDTIEVSYSYLNIKPIYKSTELKDNAEEEFSYSFKQEDKKGDIIFSGSRITGIESDKYGVSIIQSTNVNLWGYVGDSIYVEGILSDDKPMEGNSIVRKLGDWNDMYVKMSKDSSYLNMGNINIKEENMGDITGIDLNLETNFPFRFVAGQNRGKNMETQIEVIENVQGPYFINGEDMIGMYLVPNSVKVYLNGVRLKENIDYTVDYYNGTLTFMNNIVLSYDDKVMVSAGYMQDDIYSTSVYSYMGYKSKYGTMGISGFYYNEIVDTTGFASYDINLLRSLADTGTVVADGGIYVGENKGRYIREDSIYVYKGYNMGDMEVYFRYKGYNNGDYIFSPAIGGFVFVGENAGDYAAERVITLPNTKKKGGFLWNKGKNKIEIGYGLYIGNNMYIYDNTKDIYNMNWDYALNYNEWELQQKGFVYSDLYKNPDRLLLYKRSPFWINKRYDTYKYSYNNLIYKTHFANYNVSLDAQYDSTENIRYLCGTGIKLNDNIWNGQISEYVETNSLFHREIFSLSYNRFFIKPFVNYNSAYDTINIQLTYEGGLILDFYTRNTLSFLRETKNQYEKRSITLKTEKREFAPQIFVNYSLIENNDTLTKNIIGSIAGDFSKSMNISYNGQIKSIFGESRINRYESVLPGTGNFSYDSLTGEYYPDEEGDYIIVTDIITTQMPFIESNIGTNLSYGILSAYYGLNTISSDFYIWDNSLWSRYSLRYGFGVNYDKNRYNINGSYGISKNADFNANYMNENENVNIGMGKENMYIYIYMKQTQYVYSYSERKEEEKGIRFDMRKDVVSVSPFTEMYDITDFSDTTSIISAGIKININRFLKKASFFYNASFYVNRGDIPDFSIQDCLMPGFHSLNDLSVSYPLFGGVLKGTVSYNINASKTEEKISLLMENKF